MTHYNILLLTYYNYIENKVVLEMIILIINSYASDRSLLKFRISNKLSDCIYIILV